MAAIELVNTPLFSDANLVSYYRFSSGALTTDSKGTNTLTNNNTVGSGTGAFGDANGAADFGASNTNKYFSRADALGIDLQGAYTVTGWVNITTVPSAVLYNIVDWRSNAGGNNNLQNPFYGDLTGLKLGANMTGTNYSAKDFGTGVWHMVTVTQDGSGNVILYSDGTSFLTGSRVNGGGTSQINIGSSTGPGNFICGLMDDLAFFNRALTSTEINNLYLGNWPNLAGEEALYHGISPALQQLQYHKNIEVIEF